MKLGCDPFGLVYPSPPQDLPTSTGLEDPLWAALFQMIACAKMTSLEVTYNRDECIAVIRDYYQFLTKLYLDESGIVEPRGQGERAQHHDKHGARAGQDGRGRRVRQSLFRVARVRRHYLAAGGQPHVQESDLGRIFLFDTRGIVHLCERYGGLKDSEGAVEDDLYDWHRMRPSGGTGAGRV